jgi:hypothetical protein
MSVKTCLTNLVCTGLKKVKQKRNNDAHRPESSGRNISFSMLFTIIIARGSNVKKKRSLQIGVLTSEIQFLFHSSRESSLAPSSSETNLFLGTILSKL